MQAYFSTRCLPGTAGITGAYYMTKVLLAVLMTALRKPVEPVADEGRAG